MPKRLYTLSVTVIDGPLTEDFAKRNPTVSRTIEVRGVFPNDTQTLYPGLFVRIRVPRKVLEGALLVPERAIGTDLGGKYLYVVGADNVVEQRYVTLGPLQSDGMIVIDDGLEGDESYIRVGLMRARPGFPVTAQTEEEAAKPASPEPATEG